MAFVTLMLVLWDSKWSGAARAGFAKECRTLVCAGADGQQEYQSRLGSSKTFSAVHIGHPLCLRRELVISVIDLANCLRTVSPAGDIPWEEVMLND